MTNAPVETERKRDAEDCAGLLPGRLSALGYRRSGSYTETDDYYGRPDVDYLRTVECLRVRERDDFCEITYKPATTEAATDGIVSKRETNVRLDGAGQGEEARRLLEAIGMVFLARVTKHRSAYTHPVLDEVTVTLDTVEDVGVFVETEVNTSGPAGAAEVLTRVEEELGLHHCPPVLLPYRDLVLARLHA
ncbi:class IV adenylate cyclase [Streptomyces sp. NPDC047928]|uniref:class IV adenylate cyclase n=1 Tax=unclassified Streptomyces TaxID=2593676 RepID=UPI00371000A5